MAQIKRDLEQYWEKVSRYRLTGCKASLQWLTGMAHLNTNPLLTKALQIFHKKAS